MRSERGAEQKSIGLAAASPEQWLQGIVDLKRQGRDEEAEKQLGDFRKRGRFGSVTLGWTYRDFRRSRTSLNSEVVTTNSGRS